MKDMPTLDIQVVNLWGCRGVWNWYAVRPRDSHYIKFQTLGFMFYLCMYICEFCMYLVFGICGKGVAGVWSLCLSGETRIKWNGEVDYFYLCNNGGEWRSKGEIWFWNVVFLSQKVFSLYIFAWLPY